MVSGGKGKGIVGIVEVKDLSRGYGILI